MVLLNYTNYVFKLKGMRVSRKIAQERARKVIALLALKEELSDERVEAVTDEFELAIKEYANYLDEKRDGEETEHDDED